MLWAITGTHTVIGKPYRPIYPEFPKTDARFSMFPVKNLHNSGVRICQIRKSCLEMCVVLEKKKTEIRFVFHEQSFQFPAFFGTYHDKARITHSEWTETGPLSCFYAHIHSHMPPWEYVHRYPIRSELGGR